MISADQWHVNQQRWPPPPRQHGPWAIERGREEESVLRAKARTMMFSHLSLPVKLCLVMLCRVYRPSVRPYLMPLFELLSPTIPSRPSQRMLHAKNPAAWNTGTKTENKGGVQGGYHVSRGCFSCGVRVRMLIERERERESCYVNRVLRSKNRLFSFPSHVSQGGGGGGGGGGDTKIPFWTFST